MKSIGGSVESQSSASDQSDAEESRLLPLSVENNSRDSLPPAAGTRSRAVQLVIGAGGIWASFIYYGTLQEDVFRYEAADGRKFTQAWYLQVLESLANVVFASIALGVIGATRRTNGAHDKTANKLANRATLSIRKGFAISGASQLCSKGFTSLALANGLSFPVATLAKSAKLAPVMLGSLLLGGAKYSLRDYMQVLAIIAGTAILSLTKKKGSGELTSQLGAVFILLALCMDGVTGGVQKRLLANMKSLSIQPQPYEFMLWTNLFMCMLGVLISLILGDLTSGMNYCSENPQVFSLIWRFSLCSAIGQSFIFYTVARFDPLVCGTVTTTRKIFSVLLSIFFKGHVVTFQGWCGLGLALCGILSEIYHKVTASRWKVKQSSRN